jgi:LacI family transcriptional regulator
MIPSVEPFFFGSVIHGISNLASESGYDVLIYQSNESQRFEAKGIQAFIGARVDGILISIAKETKDLSHFEEVKKRNIPLVLFDRLNEELDFPSVEINDYKGAQIAVDHFINQGYRRIAHVAGPCHIHAFSERVRGYKDALQKHGLPFEPELFYEGDVSLDAGRKAATHFLSLPNPPDAILAVEDFTALGVIKRLKEDNINIPQQVGVFGFCNDLFGEHITPGLSTIDQQTIKMGQRSFSLLHELIENKNKIINGETKITLDPVPIFRNSSLRNKF